jgi:hypothetical protein
MADELAEQIQRSSGYAAIGFGLVALVAPRAFATMYGLPQEANIRMVTRLWGTRTAMIGAIAVGVGEPGNRRAVTQLGVALNAIDALCVAAAGPKVSLRTRVLGPITSGSFAAALGYALTRES